MEKEFVQHLYLTIITCVVSFRAWCRSTKSGSRSSSRLNGGTVWLRLTFFLLHMFGVRTIMALHTKIQAFCNTWVSLLQCCECYAFRTCPQISLFCIQHPKSQRWFVFTYHPTLTAFCQLWTTASTLACTATLLLLVSTLLHSG